MALLSTDQIDVAVDPATNDIPAQGDLTMTSGIAAVIQGARIRLRAVAGEWFINLDFGVALYERDGVPASRAILGQKFNRLKAINEYRDALLGTSTKAGVPGLVELLKLEVAFDGPTRTMTVLWQARTAFGDTPVDTLKIGA